MKPVPVPRNRYGPRSSLPDDGGGPMPARAVGDSPSFVCAPRDGNFAGTMAVLAGKGVVFDSTDDHVPVSVKSEPVTGVEQPFEGTVEAAAGGVPGDQAIQVDVGDQSASAVVTIAVRHLGEDLELASAETQTHQVADHVGEHADRHLLGHRLRDQRCLLKSATTILAGPDTTRLQARVGPNQFHTPR